MEGTRPSSLLLRNRTTRSSAGSDDLNFGSRRVPSSHPFPSALDDDRPAHKGGEVQAESMLLGWSEGSLNGAEDLLSGGSSETEKHDFDWLLTPPGIPQHSTPDDENVQPGDQKEDSSAVPATASKSTQNCIAQSESGSQTSISSAPHGNVSSNTNRPLVQHASISSVTSRKLSTPNKLPTPARPLTPNKLSTQARPSTPNKLPTSTKPLTPNRPSTPNKPSTAARPSTPNRSSTAARPSTPNRTSTAVRPSTPNRPSTTAISSAPNRSSTEARPSPPNKSSTAVRPNTPNRPSTTAIARSSTPSRSSTTAKQSAPNGISAPARPSTPTKSSTSGRPSAPVRPSTPNKRGTSASPSPQAAAPTRPSTPNKRVPSASTQAAPQAHSDTSSPSTPAEKPRPLSSSMDKIHPVHVSRPSTPPSRPQISATSNPNSKSNVTARYPQIPAGSNSITSRATSRASTPTRRTPAPVSAPVASRSTSAGRLPASRAKNSGPPTRPNSPGPKTKISVQPILPPDFPLDMPPNLRTKVPERPASAGRTRPGAKLTVTPKLDSEPSPPINLTRRPSPSQASSRGRIRANSPKPSNEYGASPTGLHKMERDGPTKKASKTPTTESNGLGRTLTKKSLKMALKHMDIRQGSGGIRGMSLFPHSIRSASSKGSPGRSSGILTPTSSNETDTEDNSWNGTTSGSASVNDGFSENGDIVTSFPHGAVLVARVTEPNPYEHYCYDEILLKIENREMNWSHNDEDSIDLLRDDTKDTEWLHSADNANQISAFEQYETLPEPFGLT